MGIEADNFPSPDKMSLHLTNIVNAQLGPTAMTLIHTSFDDFKNSRVLVANCQRSPTEVYVRDGNVQRFYVRTGPATTELTGSNMVEYITQRVRAVSGQAALFNTANTAPTIRLKTLLEFSTLSGTNDCSDILPDTLMQLSG